MPAAFLVVFFAYPVVAIVGQGLRPDGRWRLDVVGDVLADPDIAGVVWFTVWQAAVSTVVTLVVAMPAAYVFARYRFRGAALLRAAVTVPFVLPTVMVGAAFLALLGRGGLLDEYVGTHYDETVLAIVAAHAFLNFSVVVRTVGALWSHVDPRQAEAARVLGASRWRAFASVTLPALRPAIAAASVIVFLFTFTSFGVIQTLGGPRHATIEVEIYEQTAQLLDLPTAAVLSLLQLAVVVALLACDAWLSRRTRDAQRLVRAGGRPPRGREWLWVGGAVATVAVLMLPLVVLVERSFVTTDGYGLGNYRALLTESDDGTLSVAGVEVIGNSLRYAGLATLFALVVGVLAACGMGAGPSRLSRVFRAALMLPLGVSAVTVGFGFLITLDEPPLDLRQSEVLIPLAQALVAMPFVVRVVLPVLRSIDDRLRQAAAVLGASPTRVWWEVDAPMLARSVLVAAGFSFAISLGEFGATVFIARPDTTTVPVAIARLLSRPGAENYGQAMALSVVLMVLCAAAVLAFDRVRPSTLGDF